MKKKHVSLCTGIGGFDLAAEEMGWENMLHCEINPELREYLKKRFQNSDSHDDIRTLDLTRYRGTIDVLSAGFPCQPYSTAGKRKGKNDERHLWPFVLRAIVQAQPRWVVGENVRGLINWNAGLVFHEVQNDLEAAGYEVLPFLCPAAGVNAPHERYRVWFIAHARGDGYGSVGEFTKYRGKTRTSEEIEEEREWFRSNTGRVGAKAPFTDAIRKPGAKIQNKERHTVIGSEHIGNGQAGGFWRTWPTQPPICDGNDGFPDESLRRFVRDHGEGIITEKEIDKIVAKAKKDARKAIIAAAGNAVVPPLVLQFFKAIEAYENQL